MASSVLKMILNANKEQHGDTVAFELYWAAELNHGDIQREDVGGKYDVV